MKIIRRLFFAVLCVIMTVAAGVPAFASDTPSPWAVELVRIEVNRGYVPANIQTDYTKPITRAEFCALAVNLYESVMKSEIEGRMTFIDTNDVYVEKAAHIGLVKGTGGNRFSPDTNLAREMAAVLMVRLAEAIGYPLPRQAAAFDDMGSASNWAVEAIGSVYAAGIMNGIGKNRFSPKQPYTREQSIVTMGRLIDFMISSDDFVHEDHVIDSAAVQYVRTQYTGNLGAPAVTVIKSLDELKNFGAANNGHSKNGGSYLPENDFAYAVEKYTDDFFVENYLVFVEVSEGSGSIRHEVGSITNSGDITIKRIFPEIGTDDMAQWVIIIELEAAFAPAQFRVIFY